MESERTSRNKGMMLSAISIWKSFDLSNPLLSVEWDEKKKNGALYSNVTYAGHKASDGSVRIFARFARPVLGDSFPAILLLPDAGQNDEALMKYFLDKGYAVLMPDYEGRRGTDDENRPRTLYPESLKYADYLERGGYDRVETSADKTCWYEWTYVALYSIEYLRSRKDVDDIGVVGIRTGGEIAWKAMLSPHVKCGVPINAVGWQSCKNVGKFADTAEINMSDEKHRYIAGVESQSYAPLVKCPVLVVCSLRDVTYDYDRAYDTYYRIGNPSGSAIVYSPASGGCIGATSLKDLDLFLERYLKGREVYIPKALNATLKTEDGALKAEIECDPEGILEEAGVYYSESPERTKSFFREWQKVVKEDGKKIKGGKFVADLSAYRYAGAKMAFVYAYAKYINGFKVVSKIMAKKFDGYDEYAPKSRLLYSSSSAAESFGVAACEEYSVGGVFLEKEALPKLVKGYGGISGAYSVGGIMTYKIGSPRYVPGESAMIEFDAYAESDTEIKVSVDCLNEEGNMERFSAVAAVKGGGKWKRIIFGANELKSEKTRAPLSSFSLGQTLVFDSEHRDTPYAVTNILWL